MRFTLNGRQAAIPPDLADEPLLFVLRDHFGLNGPKFGCGVGACGACTVIVDGEAVRACSVAAAGVEGTAIVTLEGLARDGEPHPVQSAWIEQSVPQCGYCQNGQIMTAVALLERDPAADARTIDEAMDGVFCRCGTQARIRRAIAVTQLRLRTGR
ncbi:MAG: (2Fe-2S)-binding protein [Reyranellaceae bacterium]